MRYDKLPAFTPGSLVRRNHWLIRLRWYAAIGVLAGSFGAWFLLGERQQFPELLSIFGILILSNLVYRYSCRESGALSKTGLIRLLQTQMMVDLVLLSLLIHFTGGIESPLAFFYVFHIIIASIIFPGRVPYFYAAVAMILYTALLGLETAHWVPHFCFYPGLHMAENPHLLITTWLIFLTTVFASAYLAKHVTDRHRRVRVQLELANTQLREINRSKTEFFRLSSHEMKSPLITVQSALMVIRDVLGEGVDPRAMDMIERAVRKTDEMLIMLKELADLTYGSLQVQPERTEVDLKKILNHAVEEQTPLSTQHKIDLRLSLPGRPIHYQGDGNALEKICDNLISNAVRYTPDRGQVSVTLRQEPGRVILEVKDTGIGIPDDEQGRIFQEFYRTPEAKRTVGAGTGLGLAIVQRMVDLLQGEIEMESEPGKGTRFRVLLPVGDSA